MALKIVNSFKMLRVISTTLNLMFYLLTIYYRGDAAPVTNIDQAMKYLSRFGYLNPGYQNSSYSSILSIKTIKDFQSFGGLKITGILDAATLKLMNTPRCEVPDRVLPVSSNRTKRFAIKGSRWPKKQLTYKISKYTRKMNKSDVDREIARAFQMWADVTDLTFVHQNNESDNADIDILFVTGEHGNCPSFNNYLGEDAYAHATYPDNGGNVHFDENQPWKINSDKGVNLFQIATHEFGHSLGLNHSNLLTAVMYQYYSYSSDFKLDKDDIEGIQELYGRNEGENLLKKLTMEFKDSVTAVKEEWMEAKNKLESELKDYRRELEKTKTELEKTRAGLSKTVNNLSEKLNANIQRVGHEIEVAEGNVKKDLRGKSRNDFI
uniref:Peptidase metallopeptidase domain-containing protein n=1 Tax=Daphnia galeata TaxID=27404 RepID=A0A8J2WKB3_9CRUS|nr:unnamed protein product [Daphnia galeata]